MEGLSHGRIHSDLLFQDNHPECCIENTSLGVEDKKVPATSRRGDAAAQEWGGLAVMRNGWVQATTGEGVNQACST